MRTLVHSLKENLVIRVFFQGFGIGIRKTYLESKVLVLEEYHVFLL